LSPVISAGLFLLSNQMVLKTYSGYVCVVVSAVVDVDVNVLVEVLDVVDVDEYVDVEDEVDVDEVSMYLTATTPRYDEWIILALTLSKVLQMVMLLWLRYQ
jgi:hypothetical protein